MAIITPANLASAVINEQPNRQPDTQVDPASGAVETPPQKDEGASKLADLARKEKALVQKMREIAAKEAALNAKEPELRTSTESAFKESLKARLSEDPLGFLEEYGISQEQLTNALLNPPTPMSPEVRKMREELNALKQSQTDSLKAQEEQRTSAYQKAVEQVRSDVTSLVDSDERFETIKEMGLHETVTELIVETHQKTGKLLSSEEAAQMVEDYVLGESLRVANLKKVQAKLKPQDPQPNQSGSTPNKTLTNRVETSPSRGRLNERQRIENAVAVAEGRPKPH
jgi:hypothetical protein